MDCLSDKSSVIIGTLGLINALVAIGAGIPMFSYVGPFWILIGLVMLAGAWALYYSRYLLGGFLILVPGLYLGAYSWALVLFWLRITLWIDSPISEGVGFAMIILTSVAAFGMRVRQRNRSKSEASRAHSAGFLR